MQNIFKYIKKKDYSEEERKEKVIAREQKLQKKAQKVSAKKHRQEVKEMFVVVYHLVPRNNGKKYHLMRMGEPEPIKVFTKRSAALNYINNQLMYTGRVKVYINDMKNHVELYKTNAK